MMRQSGTRAGHLASALLCAGVFGVLAGCILDLGPIPSCGDGYVDVAADEECDPNDDDPTPCDENCRTIAITCGNGKVDPGEACDTVDFGGKLCKSNVGFLVCRSDCTIDDSNCDRCGDGKVDPGEECDPEYVPPQDGGFANPVECASLKYPLKPYTTGTVDLCTNKCTWYRGKCGYCGDDKADPPTELGLDTNLTLVSAEEFCDGRDASPERLGKFCDSNCPQTGLRCQAQCLSDCSAFDLTQTSPESLQCCRETGDDCPFVGDSTPCCYAYTHDLENKFDESAACTNQFEMGELRRVCR